ncbi:MAG: DUF374 domain-containing protein [bacterium]|nr:DUF374 domain-containing protein [bacterium]
MKDKNAERINNLTSWLMARYIKLVFATSKRDDDYGQLKDSFARNAPLIIGGWHGTFLLAPILMPEPGEVSAVVARHGDAAVMGRMLERFGVKLIHGAGAGGKKKDKGGMFALRASLRELKAGRSIAMTADVPPGPARQAGLGIITIARLSGRPILPCAAVTSRFKVLNTWSRFVINLPFSKLVLLSGEPVYVPADADKQMMEAKRVELETKINDLVACGHEMVGVDPLLSAPPEVGVHQKPGLVLKIYRSGMRLMQPLARPILRRRAKRGKEDLSRMSERFGRATIQRPAGDLIWFHAASVGETNAVLPLISLLLEKKLAQSILLTTGTVTSARIAAKRLTTGALHQFIPLDTPAFIKRFLDHWRPDLALLVESEIWPNLMLETSARKIPVALINGIISQKSFRHWRRWGSLSRPLFGRFDLVLVQNEQLQKRIIRLGAPDVRVVGNLKIDAPALPVDELKKHQLLKWIGARPHFLAASTHPGEERQIIEAHKKLRQQFPDLLTIIVPRHPERGDEIFELVSDSGFECVKRSSGEPLIKKTDLYIADTLGELGLFFDISNIIFLGGSLVEIGGHNPIEAVRFGTAVLTGPNWRNQNDSFHALLQGKGALEVNSGRELADSILTLMSNEQELLQLLANAEKIVEEMTGAIDRTLEAITPMLPAERRAADKQNNELAT